MDDMCIIHAKEQIRIYCETCDDVICVPCIEQHQEHKLRDVKSIFDVLRDKLRKILNARQSSALTDIENCKQILKRHISKCDERLFGKEREINDAAKAQSENITQPTRVRKQLLSTALHAIESVEPFLCTKRDAFDVNCLSEICLAKTYQSLNQCYKILSMIKEGQVPNPVFGIAEYIKSNEDITFQSGDKYASFATDKQCSYAKKSGDNFDKNKEKNTNETIQKLKMFSFLVEGKQISKIVPISADTCWLIIGRKLFKLSKGSLKLIKLDSKCYSRIDDITVLNENELLLLNRNSCDILLLLEDEQVLNYSVVSKFPRFFCQILEGFTPFNPDYAWKPYSRTDYRRRSAEIQKHNIFVIFVGNSISESEFPRKKIESSTEETKMNITAVKLTSHGVQSEEVDCKNVKCGEDYSLDGVTDKIVLLSNGKTSKLYSPSYTSFNGMMGIKDKGYGFLSYGLCSDEKRNILVTDYNFSKLYLLDERLVFNKILLDHRSGLNFPSCISLKDNALWVVNNKELVVFNYKELI